MSVPGRAFLLVLLALSFSGCRGSPPASPPVRLRVLSVNIAGLPLGLSRDLEARVRRLEERLPSFEADVVLLQEVWTRQLAERLRRRFEPEYVATWSPREKDDLLSLEAVDRELDRRLGEGGAASKPFLLSAYRNMMMGAPRGGLVILSRTAPAAVAFTPFPRRPDLTFEEALGSKGLLVAVLPTAAGDVALADTHLVAPMFRLREGRIEPFDPEVRREQLDILHGELDRRRGLAVVLGGDLNLRRAAPEGGEGEYGSFLRRGFADAFDGAEDGARPDVDYVLVRSSSRTRVAVDGARMVLTRPEERVSDWHPGVLAELSLGRAD